MTTDAEHSAAKNTDRELWRERGGDFYADSLFITEGGGIGMNVCGRVIVRTIKTWHKLAIEIDRLTERETDMLAALKLARPIVQNFVDGNEATYDAVCDAIAKAEGCAVSGPPKSWTPDRSWTGGQGGQDAE